MNLRSRLKKLEQAVTDPSTAAQHEEGCICFPADENLCLNSEESRAAEELRCPLHGQRIPAGVLTITGRVAAKRPRGWLEQSQPAVPARNGRDVRLLGGPLMRMFGSSAVKAARRTAELAKPAGGRVRRPGMPAT